MGGKCSFRIHGPRNSFKEERGAPSSRRSKALIGGVLCTVSHLFVSDPAFPQDAPQPVVQCVAWGALPQKQIQPLAILGVSGSVFIYELSGLKCIGRLTQHGGVRLALIACRAAADPEHCLPL